MNDNEIKKIVKDNVKNYQIKTTSQDILNAYQAKQVESIPEKIQVPWYKKKIFSYGFPTLVLATGALVVAFVVPQTITNNETVIIDNTNNILINNSLNNQNTFSILSGVQILNTIDNSTLNELPVIDINNKLDVTDFTNNYKINYSDDEEDDDELENSESEDEDNESENEDEENNDENEEDEIQGNSNFESSFKDAIDVFDPTVTTLESMFGETIKIETKLEEGSFKGKFEIYPFKQTIIVDDETYIFYTNINLKEENEEDESETKTSYNGEILKQDNTIYKVESTIEDEVENEDSESEVEHKIKTKIYLQDNLSYLLIQQENETETEDNQLETEKSYLYQYVKDNKTIYQEKISFEQENESNKTQTSLDLEVIKDEKLYIFNNIVINSNKGLDASINAGKYKNSLSMIKDNDKRIYTSSDGEKITK